MIKKLSNFIANKRIVILVIMLILTVVREKVREKQKFGLCSLNFSMSKVA